MQRSGYIPESEDARGVVGFDVLREILQIESESFGIYEESWPIRDVS